MCILLFPKVSVHSNHSINLKKEGKLLAHELLAEIINFLPLKLKWPNLRISFIFDLFLFKKQSQWIITIKKHIYLLKNLLDSSNNYLTELKGRVETLESDQLCKVKKALALCFGGLQILSFMVSEVSNVYIFNHKHIVDEFFHIPRLVDTIFMERMTTSQMITTTKKLIDHLLSVKENNNNILVAIDSSDKYVLKSARKALNVFLDFKIEEKKIQEKENVEE
ncbi:hypothetical protein ACQ4LE_000963 [Meloidogyne hapla]